MKLLLIRGEIPRLCRRGSRSLTDPAVCFTILAIATVPSGPLSHEVLVFASDRLRSGPFEGPATVKPPALPGDIYLQARMLFENLAEMSPGVLSALPEERQE